MAPAFPLAGKVAAKRSDGGGEEVAEAGEKCANCRSEAVGRAQMGSAIFCTVGNWRNDPHP